jgi:hypothetical protein
MSMKLIGVTLAAAVAVTTSLASAQPRSNSRETVLDDLVRRLQICGETGDATRRLQCYDQIGRSMGNNPPPGTPNVGPRADLPNNAPMIGAPPGTAPGGGDSSFNPVPYADRAYNPNDPNDQRGVGADPYPPPPRPQVRRTGPGPLPGRSGALPIVSLQTSQFGYNEQRYWQVTVDVANNVGRVIDSEIQCTFTNGGRPVKDGYFLATAIAPGEHVTTEVLGPPTTTYVDGVTCRVLNPV